MDSQNNIEINTKKIKDASLPTQLPLKIALLYKDVFSQYITKIIELKKYSENDTLKDISKQINVAYRRVDTKHPLNCTYMFLYEGNELSQSVPLKKALSIKHVNFKRDGFIIAFYKNNRLKCR